MTYRLLGEDETAKDRRLREIVEALLRVTDSTDCVSAGKERLLIRQVKSLIAQSLDRDVSLAYLAGEVYLHPKYLSDIFKRETGVKLSDYVLELRLARAKLLLRETTLKIRDVSAMCGLSSQKYFASLFKQRTGRTPTAYRED